LKVIDTLLPEERWYINQVLGCCVYDENGQLYSRSTPIFRQLVEAGDSFLRTAQEAQWAQHRQLPPTEEDRELGRIFGGGAPQTTPQPAAPPKPETPATPKPAAQPEPAPQPVAPPKPETPAAPKPAAQPKAQPAPRPTPQPIPQKPYNQVNNSADDMDKFADLMEAMMKGKGGDKKEGK
jgi:outer membrane biosynthesis protein TonB